MLETRNQKMLAVAGGLTALTWLVFGLGSAIVWAIGFAAGKYVSDKLDN